MYFVEYINYRTYSASFSRAKSLVKDNEPNWNEDLMIFTRQGFLNFYKRASYYRPNNVMEDIVFQEMAYKLIDKQTLNQNINCKNPNNYQKLLQLKHSFVEYLNNKFILNEKMLIKSMIKKASINMYNNKFDGMNDDVLNLILKYLHPLNLNEIDYRMSIVDQTIKNHFQYELATGCTEETVVRKCKWMKQHKFNQLFQENKASLVGIDDDVSTGNNRLTLENFRAFFAT